MRIIKPIFFTIAAASVLGFAGCKKKTAETTEAATDKSIVHITTLQSKSIGIDTVKLSYGQNELRLTGKVSFDQDKVSNVYPLASGNVLSVKVSLGDKVKKGQVLAVLRSSEINDYQNQYAVATSTLALAKKNKDNAEQLFNSGYYSQNQVLSAQNDYLHAESDLSKIKQQLKIFGASAGKADAEYNVVAPIDGYVVEKNISENMQVRADNNTNLFTVSYLNVVWVVADVYESDLSRVNIGDPVDITTLAYPDKTFKGTVEKINSLLDPVSKTLKLRIVLNNTDGLLKPEMFAIVKVHSANTTKYITIPTRALVFDNSQYTVVVAKNDTTFQKRVVKVLRSDGDKTTIQEGLNPGERIVTDGSLLVSFSAQ